jgi:hypothetical protein
MKMVNYKTFWECNKPKSVCGACNSDSVSGDSYGAGIGSGECSDTT